MELADAIKQLNELTVKPWNLRPPCIFEITDDVHPVTAREEAESKKELWRRQARDDSVPQLHESAQRHSVYWDLVYQLCAAACLNGPLRGSAPPSPKPFDSENTEVVGWVAIVADNAE